MPLPFRSLGSGLRFAKSLIYQRFINYYAIALFYPPSQPLTINHPPPLGSPTWRPFCWGAPKRKRPAAHPQISPGRRSPFNFSAPTLKQNNNYVSGPLPHYLIARLPLDIRPFNITDIRLSRLPCSPFSSPHRKVNTSKKVYTGAPRRLRLR